MPIFNQTNSNNSYGTPVDLGAINGEVTFDPSLGSFQKCSVSKGRGTVILAFTGIPAEDEYFRLWDHLGTEKVFSYDYDGVGGTGTVITVDNSSDRTIARFVTATIAAINTEGTFTAATTSNPVEIRITHNVGGIATNSAIVSDSESTTFNGLYTTNFSGGNDGLYIDLSNGDGVEGDLFRLWVFSSANDGSELHPYTAIPGAISDVYTFPYTAEHYYQYEFVFVRNEWTWCLSQFNGGWNMD